MDAMTWAATGRIHDFGHPDADGLRIETYNAGEMDFTAFDGGIDDGEEASYTLMLDDQRVLLAILLDNLTMNRERLGGCPLAGYELPNNAPCPFCAPKEAA